jgi:uncharacterized membrane protein
MIDFSLTILGLILIIGIDSIYLNLNKNMYKPIIDPNENINIFYAILTWLSIILSIQLIILSRPDINSSNVFVNGLILGFATYSIYNFTNAATYPSKWTNTIIIGDTLWGMTLTGTIAYSMYKIKEILSN